MWMLRNIYHLIPLNWRIPTHPVLVLSNNWLKSYQYFCTLVPWASMFKLWTPKCYKHADTLRHIRFNFPCWADSNETLSDSGRYLPAEVSPFFSLQTSIAMLNLRNLYHLISLGEWTPMRPFLTLADICPLRYQPFCPFWPLQPCRCFETYTIWFSSTGRFQLTLCRCFPTAGSRAIHTFVP